MSERQQPPWLAPPSSRPTLVVKNTLTKEHGKVPFVPLQGMLFVGIVVVQQSMMLLTWDTLATMSLLTL